MATKAGTMVKFSHRLGDRHVEIIDQWIEKYSRGPLRPEPSEMLRRMIELTEPMLDWDLEDVDRFAETGECP